MHELSIMQSILDIVLEHAEKYNVNKILKINLDVGELSDIIPEWMQKYFDFISNGTIAENAELVIEKKPALLRCQECNHEYTIKKISWQFLCPKCNSTNIEFLSGKEFKIKSIDTD